MANPLLRDIERSRVSLLIGLESVTTAVAECLCKRGPVSTLRSSKLFQIGEEQSDEYILTALSIPSHPSESESQHYFSSLVFVYDCTNRLSFKFIEKSAEELDSHFPWKFSFTAVLAINTMWEVDHVVTEAEGISLVKRLKVPFFLTDGTIESLKAHFLSRSPISCETVLVGCPGTGRQTLVSKLYKNPRFLRLGNYTSITHSENGIMTRDIQILTTENPIPFLINQSFHSILAIFSIDDRHSFTLIQNYLFEIHYDASFGRIDQLAIVGTKSDLEETRQVSFEEASQFASSLNIRYFEISTRTSQNLDTIRTFLRFPFRKITWESLLSELRSTKIHFSHYVHPLPMHICDTPRNALLTLVRNGLSFFKAAKSIIEVTNRVLFLRGMFSTDLLEYLQGYWDVENRMRGWFEKKDVRDYARSLSFLRKNRAPDNLPFFLAFNSKLKRHHLPFLKDPHLVPLAILLGKQIEPFQYLISHHFDPNIQFYCGFTALHFAAMCRRFQYIEPLIRAGANLELRDMFQDTPLCTALRAVPKFQFRDQQDASQCLESYPDGIRTATDLINCGANVSVKTIYDYTPLHLAIEAYEPECSLEFIRLLLEQKADPNALTSSEQSPLMLASQNTNCDKNLLLLLLKNRADPAYIDSKGNSILSYCSGRGTSWCHIIIQSIIFRHPLDCDQIISHAVSEEGNPIVLACLRNYHSLLSSELDEPSIASFITAEIPLTIIMYQALRTSNRQAICRLMNHIPNKSDCWKHLTLMRSAFPKSTPTSLMEAFAVRRLIDCCGTYNEEFSSCTKPPDLAYVETEPLPECPELGSGLTGCCVKSRLSFTREELEDLLPLLGSEESYSIIVCLKYPLVENYQRYIFREFNCLYRMRYTGCAVPVLGLTKKTNRNKETDCLVTVLCKTNMFNALFPEDLTKPSLPTRLCWLTQALKAIYQCHEHEIYHRDISLNNFLISDEGKVYLSDFAASISHSSICIHSSMRIGTQAFTAPEIYDPNVKPDCASEVYSTAILIHTLYSGELPDFDPKLFARGLCGPLQITQCVPEEVRDSVQQAVAFNRDERPTIKQLIEHVLQQI